MKLDLDTCPLLSYLDQNPMENLDDSLIREFYEAAKGGGSIEEVYSYGLILHKFVCGEFLDAAELDAIPQDTQQKIWEKSYEVFAYTAEQGYGEGLVMAAWCALEGLGTAPDAHAARAWYEAATKSNEVPADDVRLSILKSRLSANTAPKPSFN